MARSLRNKLASLTLCCTVVETSPAVMMASTVLQESTSQQEVTEEVHEAVTFPLEGEYIIDQAHGAVHYH